MNYKTEVSLTIPNPEDLYCINCKINLLNMQTPIIKSLFHCQILTCRLIIYSVRCCIASPSIENIQDLIHVIVSKKFYSTGKLQQHLSNLKVQFTNAKPVHLKIYEACLKYMFTFKLAPLWNLVGKCFYLHGFNFLCLPCSIDAIEWNIIFKGKDGDAKLEIKPMIINLLPFTLESLSPSCSLIKNFLTNSSCTINSINLSLFQSMWIYVLPKLTKARVISVSKILPESCPFKNYDDLRRHWKNMYSYRLPKTVKGMLFYEVIFPMNPNQQFTYPEVCILSKIPEGLACKNKNKIASEFIKNLSTNIRSVCGEVIKFGNLFPELNLEYSCVIKRKSVNYKEKNEDRSQNHFIKTSTDYIIKPANENMNLSSLFSFKGFDKMSIPMKNHSQKIFSIMKNQKRKKMSIIETNNRYLTTNDFREQNFNKESYDRNSTQYQLLQKKKTVIDNIDDICSYYDIPSMHSNTDDVLNKNQNIMVNKDTKHLCQPNFTCIVSSNNSQNSKQLLNKKPVIKNIENVCFDLNNIKKIQNINEIYNPFVNVKQTNQTPIQYLLDSANTSNSFSDLNLFNNSSDEKQVINKMQQTTSTVNSILQNETVQKLKNKDLLKYQNQAESCDKLRSLLSRFDLYNTYQKNYDDDIEKIIFNQNETTNQPVKKSQNLENKSLLYSPSLIYKFEQWENRKEFLENLPKKLSSKPNQNVQSYIFNKEQTSLYALESSKSMTNEKEVSHLQSSLSDPHLSIQFKYNNTQESENNHHFHKNKMNYKISQSSLSKTDLPNLTKEKKSKYSRLNQNFSKNEKIIINKSQSLLSDKASTNKQLFEMYKYHELTGHECKTPISVSMLSLNTKLENVYTSELQCSPIIFTPSNISEIKIRNVSLKNKSNNCIFHDKKISNSNQLQLNSHSKLKNYSDSMSILSQSSNESSSSNFETYKLAYTEALTFD